LGRTLFAPSELPVGILMSLIGAPYFLYLLLRRKRHAEY
jgi:iron complex transport system permease protein